MSKKIYIKDESFDPIYKEVSRGFYAKTRIMPTLLIFAGLFVFSTQVLLPLMVFKTQDESSEIIDNATVLGRLAGFSEFEFSELRNNKALNNLNSGGDKTEIAPKPEEYFYDPKQNNKSDNNVAGARASSTPEFFYLTVPKLGIKEAKVEINAETLNPEHALGHYPGTELPGEVGNSFVFGHSVLPWFYNPQNYKTIFSTLGKMEKGDTFFVIYNNRELTYKVEGVVEVPPSEVDPLAELKPKYLNDSTMVLMTCSPPGTRLRRLMVNAVMVN
jgi:sortase A